MPWSDYLVFVDESGDHSLASIDAEYPIFVLAFCVFNRDTYLSEAVPKIKALKIRHFGHDLAILHERDIRRRTGWFSKISKADHDLLVAELSDIMRGLDFKIISVIIDKHRLKARYKNPDHPYHLALGFGLERIERFLASRNQAGRKLSIVCEARGGREDADLELAFRRVCDGANYRGERYPHEIAIADKKCNSEGLQIADLTARPIGMSYTRADQPNRAYDALAGKLYQGPYGANGWGRKIFP